MLHQCSYFIISHTSMGPGGTLGSITAVTAALATASTCDTSRAHAVWPQIDTSHVDAPPLPACPHLDWWHKCSAHNWDVGQRACRQQRQHLM